MKTIQFANKTKFDNNFAAICLVCFSFRFFFFIISSSLSRQIERRPDADSDAEVDAEDGGVGAAVGVGVLVVGVGVVGGVVFGVGGGGVVGVGVAARLHGVVVVVGVVGVGDVVAVDRVDAGVAGHRRRRRRQHGPHRQVHGRVLFHGHLLVPDVRFVNVRLLWLAFLFAQLEWANRNPSNLLGKGRLLLIVALSFDFEGKLWKIDLFSLNEIDTF